VRNAPTVELTLILVDCRSLTEDMTSTVKHVDILGT